MGIKNITNAGVACQIIAKAADPFERAINRTSKSVSAITEVCTKEIRTKMYYDLGNVLFNIAGEEGFMSCTEGAAKIFIELATSIRDADVYKGDEVISREANKAIAAMEKVVAAAKSAGKGFTPMKGETALDSKITEKSTKTMADNVNNLAIVRRDFIVELANSVKGIDDEDFKAQIKNECIKIENKCNNLSDKLKDHNEVLDALGINLGQMKTNVADKMSKANTARKESSKPVDPKKMRQSKGI